MCFGTVMSHNLVRSVTAKSANTHPPPPISPIYINASELMLNPQYDFNGRYDLVKFIKEIQAQGLYACLRIGPFIESEWSYGWV